MHSPRFHHRGHPFPSFMSLAAIATLGLALSPVRAQQPAGAKKTPEVHTITEDELKQQFAGKTLFLRGGYFDNELHFDVHGQYAGSSPKASYTLSLIEIDKVHLAKRKLELEGIRYGLHFLGAAPTEDPMQASDKVRITPKKKFVKIAIDRAIVTAPKKKKSKSDAKNGAPPPAESASAVNPEGTTSLTKAQANRVTRTGPRSCLLKGNGRAHDRFSSRLLAALLPGCSQKIQLPAERPFDSAPERRRSEGAAPDYLRAAVERLRAERRGGGYSSVSSCGRTRRQAGRSRCRTPHRVWPGRERRGFHPQGVVSAGDERWQTGSGGGRPDRAVPYFLQENRRVEQP